MKARDIWATRTGASRAVRTELGSSRVWTFLGALGVVVTVSGAAFAQPATEASAAEKAKPKAAPPKADAGVVLPGDLDEPAAPASSDATAAGGWLDGAGDKAAPKAGAPKAAAETTDGAAQAPAPAPSAPAPAPADQASEPAAPPPAAEPQPEPRIRYALPQSTEEATPAPPTDYESLPLGYHQEHWFVGGGLRATWIDDSAFDPFSEEDVFKQLSLSAGRTAYAADKLSLAVSGALDFGSSTAPARGMNAEYKGLRLGLALEGRYHVRSWLYGYARVAPGALRTQLSLDTAEGASYEGELWSAAVDGALGAAVRIIGVRDGSKRSPRVWLFAEGGYFWAEKQDLSLEVSGPGAPPRAEPIELGELDPSGVTLRLGALATF